jgi:hypothetical protein
MVRYVSTPWEDVRVAHPLGLLLCRYFVAKNGGRRRVAGYEQRPCLSPGSAKWV